MSSIIPPLDVIPKLPGKAVNLALNQTNKLTDKLLQDVSALIQETAQLNSVNYNDPRVQSAKNKLNAIQKQLTEVQALVPQIQQTINTVKTVVSTAQTIKTAITAAQLLNPVTAPLFVAQQLMAIQDATIVNAIESLKQFQTIPNIITSKLATIVPLLIAAIGQISATGGNEVNNIVIPQSVLDELQNTSDYSDSLPTEFYTEFNVSDDDLQNRDDVIQQLIEQQQNLLQSLQEAPSKVLYGVGIPQPALGKIGDYYVDSDTQIVYGPKSQQNSWT
jgi:vacuolar-type H+-ATPase subunit I/STV1